MPLSRVVQICLLRFRCRVAFTRTTKKRTFSRKSHLLNQISLPQGSDHLQDQCQTSMVILSKSTTKTATAIPRIPMPPKFRRRLFKPRTLETHTMVAINPKMWVGLLGIPHLSKDTLNRHMGPLLHRRIPSRTHSIAKGHPLLIRCTMRPRLSRMLLPCPHLNSILPCIVLLLIKHLIATTPHMQTASHPISLFQPQARQPTLPPNSDHHLAQHFLRSSPLFQVQSPINHLCIVIHRHHRDSHLPSTVRPINNYRPAMVFLILRLSCRRLLSSHPARYSKPSFLRRWLVRMEMLPNIETLSCFKPQMPFLGITVP